MKKEARNFSAPRSKSANYKNDSYCTVTEKLAGTELLPVVAVRLTG